MMSISQMLKLIYDFWNLRRCFYKRFTKNRSEDLQRSTTLITMWYVYDMLYLSYIIQYMLVVPFFLLYSTKLFNVSADIICLMLEAVNEGSGGVVL